MTLRHEVGYMIQSKTKILKNITEYRYIVGTIIPTR